MQRQPHPKNSPGDFYVENQGCLACQVPEEVAPGLISHEDEPYYHCFFCKQPSTPEELERAIRAVYLGCVKAVRYGGKDPAILQRFHELESEDGCDHKLKKKG